MTRAQNPPPLFSSTGVRRGFTALQLGVLAIGPVEPRPVVAVDQQFLENFAWERIFSDLRPLEVELGTGKAGFLLERAKHCPERNFFGIEWANEFYKFAVDRFERWGLTNVRFLRTDASNFIRVVCPRNSIDILRVYHPDPWPKKRHHKRRLFQPAFVDAAVTCLVPGGRWAVQTDHAEYFELLAPLLRNHPELVEIPFDDPALGHTGPEAPTNFAIKYRREGRSIYNLAVQRRV